jgi:hypothetical protein
MANTSTGVPQSALVREGGMPTLIWYQFFVSLWQRTGAATGSVSIALDNITNVVGSILFRGPAAWIGLGPGAQDKVLRIGAQSLPEWDNVDGNSFAEEAENLFFASPNGAEGKPGFRQVETADLQGIAGQFPATATDDDAAAGHLGQYIFSEVDAGSAVAMASTVANDITSIELSPGDWDVWANIATAPAGATTTSSLSAWIGTASATDPGAPNAGAYLLQMAAIGAGLSQAQSVGMKRITVANGATQTVYLSANMTFAISTMKAYGFLGARRPR